MSSALEIPGRPRPWIMAHRGASDLAPENSLAAFALAVQHGADLVETDLWISADGEIVCHHDATLQRIFGDPRRVDAMSAAKLGRLRMIGGQGVDTWTDERLPTLEALLSVLPDGVVPMLELEDPRFGEAARIRRLVEVLGTRVGERRVGVITEHLSLLRAVKAAVPELVLGYIALAHPCGPRWPELKQPVVEVSCPENAVSGGAGKARDRRNTGRISRSSNAASVVGGGVLGRGTSTTGCSGPWWPILRLNPLYVRMAHRRGQRVCPLDPDLHRRLARYLALDVDALLTNDPRETRRRVDALR